MSQQTSNFTWRGSPLGAFIIGCIAFFSWAPSTYDRIVLQENGVTVKGTVKSSDRSNSRGLDELWVSYEGTDGKNHWAKIYAESHQYSQGQDIVLRTLSTNNNTIQIAPGERGDLRRAEIFNMSIAALLLIPSIPLLALKLRRQLVSL